LDQEITISEVYNLIGDVRKELTTNLQRLENKFDTLEAGRLSRLEKDFATKMAQFSTDQELMKKLVYGSVSVILLTFGAAALKLIFH